MLYITYSHSFWVCHFHELVPWMLPRVKYPVFSEGQQGDMSGRTPATSALLEAVCLWGIWASWRACTALPWLISYPGFVVTPEFTFPRPCWSDVGDHLLVGLGGGGYSQPPPGLVPQNLAYLRTFGVLPWSQVPIPLNTLHRSLGLYTPQCGL